MAGIDDVVAAAEHDETVAVFSHGGVINALVHTVMKTERLLCVQVDYAGVTPAAVVARREASASRRSTAPSTYGICCRETSGGRQVQ